MCIGLSDGCILHLPAQYLSYCSQMEIDEENREECRTCFIRLAIHLSRNTRKWAQNAKNEKCTARYFAPLFWFFAFRSTSCQGWHSSENSKNFMVNFFMALIKHEICLKCEKCIASVSHFMVCFAKTFAKYNERLCEKRQ